VFLDPAGGEEEHLVGGHGGTEQRDGVVGPGGPSPAGTAEWVACCHNRARSGCGVGVRPACEACQQSDDREGRVEG
jgi:hypothetical protein